MSQNRAILRAMDNTQTIIAALSSIYDAAITTLRSDIARFATDGTPAPADRAARAWCYPQVLHYTGRETRLT